MHRRCRPRASDPALSAWVAANAGSGKTHVLAQRVIRLLLAGIDPAKILCLTFTKAAAANMANRVFDTLRPVDRARRRGARREPCAKIGAQRIDAKRRARARRLFALALETPGGLKVQTIHAFCTRLLHQFPFEANVAARFEVLDETARRRSCSTSSASTCCSRPRAQPDSAARPRARQAVLAAADVTFRDMVARGDPPARRADRAGSTRAGGIAAGDGASFRDALGIGPDDSVRADRGARSSTARICRFGMGDASAAALPGGSTNDQKQGDALPTRSPR